MAVEALLAGLAAPTPAHGRGRAGSPVARGGRVTDHEATPAGASRRPQVVLGVIAVAVVATWWGWPPSLVEVGPVAAVPADSGMVAVLAALRDRMAEADPYLGRRPLETARRELVSLPPDAVSYTHLTLPTTPYV